MPKKIFSNFLNKFINILTSKISEDFLKKIELKKSLDHKELFLLQKKQVENLLIELKKNYEPLSDSLWDLIKRVESNQKLYDSNESTLDTFIHNNRIRNHSRTIEKLRWGNKLNIGAGPGWNFSGWDTLDFYHGATFHHDLRSKNNFPIEDDSYSVIFNSHVVEHIDNESGKKLITESYRILKKNGLFRLLTPDFNRFLLAYRLNDYEFFLKSGMNLSGDSIEEMICNVVCSMTTRSLDGKVEYDGAPQSINFEEVKEKLKNIENIDDFVQWVVSHISSESDYVAHVNGFTYEKLSKWLKDAGFQIVLPSSFRNSVMNEMNHPSIDNHASVSICIEAMK